MLYSVVSHFLARPVERNYYSVEQEDSVRPLSKAIQGHGYGMAWITVGEAAAAEVNSGGRSSSSQPRPSAKIVSDVHVRASPLDV